MQSVLRITEISNCDTTTLKLEGKLLEPWVAEMRSAFENAAARCQRVRLDLQHLSFADVDGIQLVRELRQRGADLAACSDFIAELLNQERL